MTEDVGCPKCGDPLRDAPTHCPPGDHGSCWWSRHDCGAVIEMRRPSRWLDYPLSARPKE